MRNAKEIRANIRELRAEMKAAGIPKCCTMNRLELHVLRANMRLEALSLELERALKPVATE